MSRASGGVVESDTIDAFESPRASIMTLAPHVGFDAVQAEDVSRFVIRGRAAVIAIVPDDLVATCEGGVLELTRD